jgi:hypothetical protein
MEDPDVSEDSVDKAITSSVCRALEILQEQFDHVQIFASISDGDGTRYVNKGFGDNFARYGQIRQWLIKEEEISRMEARVNWQRNNDPGQ